MNFHNNPLKQLDQLFTFSKEDVMSRFSVCLVCVIILVAGCQKAAEEKAMEKQIERATGGDAEVDISRKGMKIEGKTKEGAYTVTTGESTEIPNDFPSDVLIYRSSKAVSAMKIPEGFSLALTTGDDVSKVTEVYKNGMKHKGWSEASAMRMGAQTMLVYEKGDRVSNIMIAPFEQETRISVTVTTQ
jgi:hypothetical protein